MAIGLLFFLSVLGMIAGLLTTKDYKRLSRALFSLSLVLLVAGGLLFSVQKSRDGAVVSVFKAGGVLSCQQAGRSHRVSQEAGWQLHSGDHFIREGTIVRAGNCAVQD